MLRKLRTLATPRQVEAIDALLKYGSIQNAAERLGISPSRLRGLLSEAKTKAAKRGYSPEHDMNKVVPNGYHVKGVSTYYDKFGRQKGQWVKTQKDQEHQIALLLDALQETAERFTGIAKPVKPPKYAAEDLLVVIPWGDPHLGMYAWAEETGDRDYDLRIGEEMHCKAVDQLVQLCPPAKRCAIVPVGDICHTDTPKNRTERSGHALDVDTRYQKVYRAVVGTLVHSVNRALQHFEQVDVFAIQGNHDDVTAYTLSVCLAAWFRNEPRVNVDLSPGRFHWLRHGKVFIGMTHGDTCKPSQMPGIMAASRPQDWGETVFRHFYTGHLHHDRLAEFPGCTIETLRTLAPLDAYAANAGYRALSDMKADVWHAGFGRINRHIIGIERLVAT